MLIVLALFYTSAWWVDIALKSKPNSEQRSKLEFYKYSNRVALVTYFTLTVSFLFGNQIVTVGICVPSWLYLLVTWSYCYSKIKTVLNEALRLHFGSKNGLKLQRALSRIRRVAIIVPVCIVAFL